MMTANERRLRLCDPEAAKRFLAVVGRALAYGADAYIEKGAWRTPAQQRKKVRLGFSQTLESAHGRVAGGNPECQHHIPEQDGDGDVVINCACGASPASRAVHIVSRKYFYFTHAPLLLPAFAVRIGTAALKEGCEWGGLYGPRNAKHRAAWDGIWATLKIACTDEEWTDAEAAFAAGRAIGACWDPLHIEFKGATT